MRLLIAALLVSSAPAAAQDTLRLAALQQAAVTHDPRLRELALEETATDLRLRNLAAERLPRFGLRGEATRQSEVARIPIALPNAEPPTPPKDRYELALEGDWLLYDGGALAARREAERAELAARRAELTAELYPLRAEVAEAFFRALLLQERAREVATLIDDLRARLSEVREQVAAGAALPGDTAAVLAELLRATQQRSEAASDHAAALGVLEELTGRRISAADVLRLPDLEDEVARVRSIADPDTTPMGNAAIRVHPRYDVFEARRQRLDRQAAVVRARTRPRLSAFGTYAYGSPGLQQFTEDFHDYWLAGLRLQWIPWSWGTADRELGVLRIQQQILDAEEAAFSERIAREVQQPLQAMQRLQAAIVVDQRIIALREQVERQARAQFAERAITAAAYVDARTDLQEARIALLRHRAELARAQAQYLATLGVPLR